MCQAWFLLESFTTLKLRWLRDRHRSHDVDIRHQWRSAGFFEDSGSGVQLGAGSGGALATDLIVQRAAVGFAHCQVRRLRISAGSSMAH